MRLRIDFRTEYRRVSMVSFDIWATRGRSTVERRTPADVATIKNIEREIRSLEGFAVVIRSNGTKPRNLPEYDYGRAARAAFTVADWKRARFTAAHPNLDVDVLRADGRVATRTMTLAKLRAEYDN